VRERWYQPQTGYASARPAVVGDLVVFGTGDGHVVARDRATGVARWSTKIANERIQGANLVARGGVIVAPVLHHTAAVDVTTGRELWRYEAPPDTVGDAQARPGQVLFARIDADESTVYIPAWGASVTAIDLNTGAVRWVWRPGRSARDTATSGVFRSGAEGVRVSGDTVFATAWHNLVRNGVQSEAWLLALNKQTGRELWRVTLPRETGGVAIQGQPALWSNLVIASLNSGYHFAVDRTSRQVVWETAPDAPDPGEIGSGNLIGASVYGDVVYHDGSNSYVYARRANDGALLWKSRYDGQFFNDLLVTETRV